MENEDTALEAEDTLLKEIEVTLANGVKLQFRPWGVSTGKRVMKRVNLVVAMFSAVSGGNVNLVEMVAGAADECVQLVADSAKVEVSEIDNDEVEMADLVDCLDAIVRINFLERPRLGKSLTTLMGSMNKLMSEDEVPEMPAHLNDTDSTQSPSSS